MTALFPQHFLAMWTPGLPEIIVILLVVLLLFGGKKLPDLARGLAKGLRIFRDEVKGIQTDLEEDEGPEGPSSRDESRQDERSAQQDQPSDSGEQSEGTTSPQQPSDRQDDRT